ncbi:MAG TPA: hypothetical protein VFP72_02370 [Kineosporiaceae bacterium]|nr:hypothetical protein [Kineosporiaceae bacterium]
MTGRPASSGRFEDWRTPRAPGTDPDAGGPHAAQSAIETETAEEAAIAARVRAAHGYAGGPPTGSQPYAQPQDYFPAPPTGSQPYAQPQDYFPAPPTGSQPYAQPQDYATAPPTGPQPYPPSGYDQADPPTGSYPYPDQPADYPQSQQYDTRQPYGSQPYSTGTFSRQAYDPRDYVRPGSDAGTVQDFTAGGHGGYDAVPASPYADPYAHPYARPSGGQDPGTGSLPSWADRDADDAQWYPPGLSATGPLPVGPPPEADHLIRAQEPRHTPAGPWPTRVSTSWVLTATGLIVVVAFAGAVALPKLFGGDDSGSVFDATTLQQPAQISGLPRLAADQVRAEDTRAAQALLTAVPEATQRVLVYGNASGVRLAVATARPPAPLDKARRETLTAGFGAGMEAAKAPVSTVDTGSLGGWFGCAATSLGTTVCLAVDGGAVVAISVTQTGQAAIDLARAARSAVELRSS